jgi:CHAT domain-containing protein
MAGFYESLRHQPPAAALRSAQLGLMERNPHPYYWASFTLVSRGN